MPLISIIIPVYNTEKFLAKCINSVRKQTLKNIEIILVNDGSTDDSGVICDYFAEHDNRIKVIHKTNGGLSDARNQGIAIANGEYLGFVDSDDYVELDMYEKLYIALRTSNYDISMCGRYDEARYTLSEAFTFENTQSWDSKEAISRLLCWDGLDSSACDKLFRKNLFDDIHFPIGKLNEDIFVMSNIIHISGGITHIGVAKYHYVTREDSITTQSFTEKKLDLLEALSSVSKLVTAHYPEIFGHMVFFIVKNLLYLYSILFSSKLKKSYYKKIIDKFTKHFISSVLRNTLLSNYDKAKIILYFTPLYYVIHTMKSILKHLQIISTKVAKKTIPIQVKRTIKSAHHRLTKFHNKLNRLQLIHKTSEPAVIFISTPTHGNLGDQAIVHAQYQLFRDLHLINQVIEFSAYEYQNYKQIIQKRVNDNDLIIIDGGGNLGTLWFEVELKIQDIITRFQNNKIVIFPNTVFYSDSEHGNQKLLNAIELYSGHNNLVIAARENKSFSFLKSHFINKIIHCPDIVLYLKNSEFSCFRSGALLCLRSDKEKSLSDSEVLSIYKAIDNNNLEYKYISTVEPITVTLDNRSVVLQKKLLEFASSEIVITDRLHAMIFCAITGTPCIAYDNLSNKISGVYSSISHLPYIKLKTDNDNLEECIRKFASSNQTYHYRLSDSEKNNFEKLIAEISLAN